MKAPVLMIRGEDGQMHSVAAIRGPRGEQGPAYVLTDADKENITAAVLAALPAAESEAF